MTYIPPLTEPIETKSPEQQLDAFGRLRVSQLRTELDLKHTNDSQDLFVDKVTNGTGAINRIAADSMIQMTTAASGDWAISETFQRFSYFSGKSFLIYKTFSSFQTETNIVKRIGYFNSSNISPYDTDFDGLYLESDGTDISVNQSKGGVITKIVQSSWNKDLMDGTGSSGYNVDWSKGQILVIDFEYLGLGRVRFGLNIDGITIYFHEFKNANNLSSPYMLQSNHSLRWEIRQTGAGSGTFNYVCATVATEGEIGEIGQILSVNSGSTKLDANLIGTKYLSAALRINTNFQSAYVNLLEQSILASTADNFLWEIILNPTISGTVTFTPVSNSSLDIYFGDTTNTVTGGVLISSGYGYGQSVVSDVKNNAVRLGTSIDGTADVFALVITPLGSNLDIYSSLSWREFD